MNGVGPESSSTKHHLTTLNMSSALYEDSSKSLLSENTSDSSLMDRISSIHDNPFYKSFGLRHPRAPRDVPNTPPLPKRSSDTENAFIFREELGEYKPGSGFVQKLMDKFASLSASEEPSTHYFKRAASLDNLSDVEINSVRDVAITHFDYDRSGRSPNKHIVKHRTKSTDSFTHPSAHSPKQVDRKREHLSTSPVRSLKVAHFVAPDVLLARDDIILIENPPKQANEGIRIEDPNKLISHMTGARDEESADELPKPNTVLTVRSFFESSSQADTEWQSKGAKLSPVTMQFPEESEVITSSRDSHSQSSHNLASFSSTDLTSKHSKSSGSNTTSSEVTAPSYGSAHNVENKGVRQYLNKVIGTQSASLENRKSALRSRTTATVKAIPSAWPSIDSPDSSASNPSVPASFTPSMKRTSPVMSVAPFKDKIDDSEENCYLIYSFKKKDLPQSAEHVKDQEDVAYASEALDNQEAGVVQLEETRVIEQVKETHVLNEISKTNKWNQSHGKHSAPPIPRQKRDVAHRKLKEAAALVDVAKPEDLQIDPACVVSVESLDGISLSNPISLQDQIPEPCNAAEKMEASDEPVKGIPSIIAIRMKQATSTTVGQTHTNTLGEAKYDLDPKLDSSEIPSKSLSPAVVNQSIDQTVLSNLPTEIENKIASVRKRMESSSKNKPTGMSQIFDSSQLKKKRKENQATRIYSQAEVPRLDLSGITDEHESTEGPHSNRNLSREIKPCNIEFIGANISLGRSLLDKNRTVKINIRFHEVLVQTFEYPSEEAMLEDYLNEHPDEVLVLEKISSDLGQSSSSSDDDVELSVDVVLNTPRGNDEEGLLKSNTSLAHTGILQSYRGKYQEDYIFGTILNEAEKLPASEVEAEPLNINIMQLRPADEEELQDWSTSNSSDLLF